jgi:quercetin dioxygenase-like cupin family protein
MAALLKKSFHTPDEKRATPKATAEIVSVHDLPIARVTYEVGLRWSEQVKPMLGTESCQVAHLAYFISGRLGVKMDDGTQEEVGPGEVAYIAPGHDGWGIGDEPCVIVDFARASRL